LGSFTSFKITKAILNFSTIQLITNQLITNQLSLKMPVIYHPTPIGFARIEDAEGYVCSVKSSDKAGDDTTVPTPALIQAAKQLDEYFAGRRTIFDFPIRQKGTEFQQQVWKHLCDIGYGQTISYMQQAKRMQNPLGIRAIASANGKNNLWIVVPCHRVIGSDGSLTGYAGGLWRKQWLLEHEAKVLGVGQTRLF
jgi:methylated-DNA-[protein]-cysteine S-methyltransferase